MNIQPCYIVPLLIKQPTWGGEYITKFKGITDQATTGVKIGQSYELYDNTVVTNQMFDRPAYAVAEPSDLANPIRFGEPESYTLQSIIDQDATAVLGSRVLEKTGARMTTLIKFTQAQNNSYQVHVRPGQVFGRWLPKPESWYYFQPGLLTLGLRASSSVSDYQQRCLEIDDQASVVSQRIMSGEVALAKGKTELLQFINQDHPRRFVNTVQVQAEQVIDLSQGGIHHSWESASNYPDGNVLYEVQVDIKDEYCTLRSFDQGSIKDDGSVRLLAIGDYFQALKTDPTDNQPDRFFHASQSQADASAIITTLFHNQYYITQSVSWQGKYQGKATQTNDSYHHVFVKKGTVTLSSPEGELLIAQGWSVFVPAQTKAYGLYSENAAQVLITFV